MKKISFTQILILAALVILALPVVSFFLFRDYYNSLERQKSEDGLLLIDQYLERCLQATEEEPLFLEKFQSYLGRFNYLGDAILYDGGLEVLMPDRPALQEARAEMIEAFSSQIRAGTLKSGSIFQATSGTRYIVRLITISKEGFHSRYCVAYDDLDPVRADKVQQIKSLLLPMLLLALLVLVLPSHFLREAAHSARGLRAEIDRIGAGNLSPIVEESSLRETEDLRASLNRSLQALRGMDQQTDTVYLAVSHRMRNLISSVQGYAQGIGTGVFPPETAADKILAQSRRMTELESNFSQYIALNALHYRKKGTIYLSPEETAVSRWEDFRPEAEERGVSLSVCPGGGDLMVPVSPELLDSVLDNLLSNAVRYASSAVTISAGREEGRVFLRVEDDGPGIAEKDLPHIFEPLYKGSGGHFGLGLAVAARAAELMGGALTAENRPEGGAVFILRFPAEAGGE